MSTIKPMILAVCLAASPLAAGEGESTKTDGPPKPATTKPEPIVISNETLERRFGPPDPESARPAPSRPAPPARGKGPDVATMVEQHKETEKAAKDAKQKREAAIAQARARIADLERRLLALRNPLLARPAAPEKNAEDWQELDTVERVKRFEKELQDARRALAEAQGD